MKLTHLNSRYLFFTGKGGVGKTSLACATGIALAESGARVLIVSTDPASNLDEVLDVVLGPTPTAVPQMEGLFALNIDPHVAARDYRERTVAPYRGILPPAAIQNMEEQFSGAMLGLCPDCVIKVSLASLAALLPSEPRRSPTPTRAWPRWRRVSHASPVCGPRRTTSTH